MPIPRLELDDTAVIIIDVQERLMPTIIDAGRVIANCSILLRTAVELTLPYLVTEQYPKGLGRTVEPIVGAMSDQARRVEKTRFSAAVDVVLEQMREWRRSSVLIAGVEAHVCVMQTTLDFQAAGFQCFVCRDAISASQREMIEPAVRRMEQAGAVTTGVLAAIYELLGDARHPSFRTCLDLAKAIEY